MIMISGFLFKLTELWAWLDGAPFSLKKGIFVTSLLALSFIIIGSVTDYIARMLLRIFSNILGPGAGHFVINHLTFPGTVVHELSHALLCIITGARVKRIVFFEKPGTGRLGHVDYVSSKNPVLGLMQMALIGCAPVVGNMSLSVLSLTALLHVGNGLVRAVLIYLAVSFIVHAGMSRSDIRAFLRGQFVVFPLTVICLFFLLPSGLQLVIFPICP